MEYIPSSRGQTLSDIWKEKHHDAKLRSNLFHGLARTMLQLACVPLPKIGSFALDKQGYLSLSNRALTVNVMQLKNEDIPVDIPRDTTHSTVDAYIHDLFTLHDARLRHQPNAVHSFEDGLYQTSALMVMKSVWSCFFRRDLRHGPFFLDLSDLNQSNIFVDDNWNITCFIDLEWANSCPVELIHPPYWFSDQGIDTVKKDDYEPLHREFMDVLAEEEKEIRPPSLLSPILQQGWDKGTFWYALALTSPSALFPIFYKHIQPIFAESHGDPSFYRITMRYWNFKSYDFIKQKVKDQEQYDASLREAFESGPPEN